VGLRVVGFCRRMISDIWRLVIQTMLPLALNATLLRWRLITGSMLPQVAAESTLLQEPERDNMHTGRHGCEDTIRRTAFAAFGCNLRAMTQIKARGWLWCRLIA
jgi:hypothetical protein